MKNLIVLLLNKREGLVTTITFFSKYITKILFFVLLLSLLFTPF